MSFFGSFWPGLLIEDSYKTINKSHHHSSEDVDILNEVMDKHKDGKVTLSDVETLVNKYLLGQESRY